MKKTDPSLKKLPPHNMTEEYTITRDTLKLLASLMVVAPKAPREELSTNIYGILLKIGLSDEEVTELIEEAKFDGRALIDTGSLPGKC